MSNTVIGIIFCQNFQLRRVPGKGQLQLSYHNHWPIHWRFNVPVVLPDVKNCRMIQKPSMYPHGKYQLGKAKSRRRISILTSNVLSQPKYRIEHDLTGRISITEKSINNEKLCLPCKVIELLMPFVFARLRFYIYCLSQPV